MTDWHYKYNWRRMHIDGTGHFGNWVTFSKKATVEDLKDPKKACSAMLKFLKTNENNNNLRDFSGIRVVDEDV